MKHERSLEINRESLFHSVGFMALLTLFSVRTFGVMPMSGVEKVSRTPVGMEA